MSSSLQIILLLILLLFQTGIILFYPLIQSGFVNGSDVDDGSRLEVIVQTVGKQCNRNGRESKTSESQTKEMMKKGGKKKEKREGNRFRSQEGSKVHFTQLYISVAVTFNLYHFSLSLFFSTFFLILLFNFCLLSLRRKFQK